MSDCTNLQPVGQFPHIDTWFQYPSLDRAGRGRGVKGYWSHHRLSCVTDLLMSWSGLLCSTTHGSHSADSKDAAEMLQSIIFYKSKSILVSDRRPHPILRLCVLYERIFAIISEGRLRCSLLQWDVTDGDFGAIPCVEFAQFNPDLPHRTGLSLRVLVSAKDLEDLHCYSPTGEQWAALSTPANQPGESDKLTPLTEMPRYSQDKSPELLEIPRNPTGSNA